jgi:hypothetical protein
MLAAELSLRNCNITILHQSPEQETAYAKQNAPTINTLGPIAGHNITISWFNVL